MSSSYCSKCCSYQNQNKTLLSPSWYHFHDGSITDFCFVLHSRWWHAWSKARSRNQLYSHHGCDIKKEKALSCFGFDVSNTCYSMMMTCLEWSTKQKSVILPSWKWYQDGESSVLFWFWYEQHLLQYDDDMPGVKHEAEISYTPFMEVISRWRKQCLVLVLIWDRSKCCSH